MEAIIPQKQIYYPETDGEPMAENTLQFEWIVTIKEGLEATFAEDADVFVAGDLFWYPTEGRPDIRYAPDVLAVFGRPKGHRRSYLQWREENIAPQVVFEILSPSNRVAEIMRKFEFYQQHGVEEYYIYNPDSHSLEGWLRNESLLLEIDSINGWVSPRMGVRFVIDNGPLELYRPDGSPFLTYQQLVQARRQAEQEVKSAQQQVQQAQQQARQAQQQAQNLAQKLREMGVDPDQIS